MEVSENLTWEIMFGEKFDYMPDINQPENTAFLNAQQKAEKQRLKQFVEGPGKVLMDRWKKQIRISTMTLFGMASSDCNCPVCWEIRKIKNIFELILEAETVINS